MPDQNDDDIKKLGECLSKLKDGLEALEGGLQEIEQRSLQALRDLQNLNSSFPETQSFLETKGLTNVSELDAQGLSELEHHLCSVLERLRGQKPS